MEYKKTCAICGAQFTTNRKDVKYCSAGCRKSAAAIMEEQRKKEVKCVVCGKMFRTKHKYAMVCSGKCAARYRLEGKWTEHPTDAPTAKYHRESLDQKARDWGIRYGEMQGIDTLRMVGGVDVDGIMAALKRLP